MIQVLKTPATECSLTGPAADDARSKVTDEQSAAALRENLVRGCVLPPVVVDWLMGLWEAIQVFDDVTDGDPVSRDRAMAALWSLLVEMPVNPFFEANRRELTALMKVQIIKWSASDSAERAGRADARSYVWRAGFFEVVLAACELVHGPQVALKNAEDILRLYGEPFIEYMKEFTHHA